MLRCHAAVWQAPGPTELDELTRVAERLATLDGLRAARAFGMLAAAYENAGDLHAAKALTDRAVAMTEGQPGEGRRLIECWQSNVTTIACGAAMARPVSSILSLDDVAALAPADPANMWIIAQTAQWQEDYSYAKVVSQLIISALRKAGVLSWLPYALAAHAEILWWTGQWTAARAAVTESVQLAEETGQSGLLGFALSCAGLVAAGLGEDGASRTYLARAVDVAETNELKPVLLYVERAQGLQDLTFDRPASAVRHLQRADELARWAGMQQPTVVAYQADLVEALLRCGDVAAASEALAALREAAERSGSRWATATALRCQAMVDPSSEDSEQLLRSSIDQLTNSIAIPFERHRSELQLGGQLRRQRRLAEARAILRTAADGFRRLGAREWTRRADAERHAAGDRDADRDQREPTVAFMRQLSPQQLQVVIGVAGGATNREVAASLFISPKTVDYHLRKACAILGVRNRTQLAMLVAAEHTASNT